ncbi:hypothetical protein BH20ACT5_BH20ACT5_11840 [soil metagenome]
MAENKTVANDGSVQGFLGTIEHDERRRDADVVCELMARVTGETPVMWGDRIVGFGHQHLRYASGRELDWFLVGFSPASSPRPSTSATASTPTRSCWAGWASTRPASLAST